MLTLRGQPLYAMRKIKGCLTNRGHMKNFVLSDSLVTAIVSYNICFLIRHPVVVAERIIIVLALSTIFLIKGIFAFLPKIKREYKNAVLKLNHDGFLLFPNS